MSSLRPIPNIWMLWSEHPDFPIANQKQAKNWLWVANTLKKHLCKCLALKFIYEYKQVGL